MNKHQSSLESMSQTDCLKVVIRRLSERTTVDKDNLVSSLDLAISNILSLLYEDDYVTLDELKTALNFSYNPSELRLLWSRLPSVTELISSYKAGAILIPGPPKNLTFIDMEDIENYPLSLKDNILQLDNNCMENNTFVVFEDVPACQWFVFLKHGIADSFGKTIERQHSKLGVKQSVPNAAISHYCASVYRMVRGNDFLGKAKLRTSSVSANGNTVVIQTSGRNYPMLSDANDDNKIISDLGMAAVITI